ncbi:MAG: hypothetical protein ACKOQM_04390 [Novosphingobium sp.]
MALVESKEVEQLLLTFLTNQGDGRFAITNGSFENFVRRVAFELDRGIPINKLTAAANDARQRAIDSAVSGGSQVDFNGRKIPLLRETDSAVSLNACPNFTPF